MFINRAIKLVADGMLHVFLVCDLINKSEKKTYVAMRYIQFIILAIMIDCLLTTACVIFFILKAWLILVQLEFK